MMKVCPKSFVIACILILIGVNAAFSGNSRQVQYFFVGTYTDAGSEGIYSFSLDPVTGKLTNNGLASKSNNPSFLALTADQKYLLAVHEIKDENGSQMGFGWGDDQFGKIPCLYISLHYHLIWKQKYSSMRNFPVSCCTKGSTREVSNK